MIPCFLRHQHLDYHLASIARQDLVGIDYEIVVLNDGIEDKTVGVVNKWQEIGLPVQYLFTGYRNTDLNLLPRVAGFALNIGIQQSTADIVVLCCAETYHLGNTVLPIIQAVESDDTILGTFGFVYEDYDGFLFNGLGQSPSSESQIVSQMIECDIVKRELDRQFAPNPRVPYFIAVRRQKLLDIGGYDEDFTGRGVEDHDLVHRLQSIDCRFLFTPTLGVHLFHPRPTTKQMFSDPAYQYNLGIFKKKKGVIHRNVGREWGRLP